MHAAKGVEGLNDMDGLTGSGILDSDVQAKGQSLPEALVGSALKRRAMAPLVDSLLKEAGVGDLSQTVETKT
ncbi:flotillin domain-containing protein [Microbulbifer spongiae]|uniref:Flotillin C-terminal domain-containing protein n=1 Tax=Microbulbifer spongiae TaxID=2944933 RepID=A0ABY9E8X5_9GAMM|nr:flotillin domain-containing protein [Microbulbifer sp. MI-G]WKD49470.1 hypothetical protein M8T91_16485 [Microbulbifer sp. MI-G]